MSFKYDLPLSQWSAEDDATLTNALGNYSVDTDVFQWYCDVGKRLNKSYIDIALRVRELQNEQSPVLDQLDGKVEQVQADDGVQHVSGAQIKVESMKVESEASFSRPN